MLKIKVAIVNHQIDLFGCFAAPLQMPLPTQSIAEQHSAQFSFLNFNGQPLQIFSKQIYPGTLEVTDQSSGQSRLGALCKLFAMGTECIMIQNPM